MMDNGGAFTDRLLDASGIAPGQSVLDIGCGGGDVTFRLAERVGPFGHVVGIDRDDTALSAARMRAETLGHTNVSFLKADLHEPPTSSEGSGYDVVTCRRVLMYLDDQVRAVRALLGVLRPGGHLVLQEHDGSFRRGSTSLPLHAAAHQLIWDTVEREGADTALGLKLHGILSEAGAGRAEIMAEAVIQTADRSAPTGPILAALSERILATGTTTREELEALDPATLDARLHEELRAAKASFLSETIFGAIAFKTTEI